MRKALVTTVIVLAFAGVACSKDSASSTTDPNGGSGCSASTATALSGDLTVKDFAFHPGCFSATAGSTISVNNQDTTTHTFTVTGTDVNVSVGAGTTQTATAPAAGTYAFHCSIHPTMTGALVVS